MGFAIVRKFLFALDDKDFLSILDGVNFYNRKVTIKRYYYNQIFGTIKKFVELKNKSDHMKLAAIIKKLALERLTKVNKSSFVRYFASKLFHAKRDDIIDKIRGMADDLRSKVANLQRKDLIEKPIERLQRKIDQYQKVFKSVVQLYKKKNNVASLSIPDLRTKLPAKFGNLRFQYVKQRNAFYINTDQSDDDMFISYVILFLRWIISECGIQKTITIHDALTKFMKRVGMPLDPYVLETLDPIDSDDSTEEPEIDEEQMEDVQNVDYENDPSFQNVESDIEKSPGPVNLSDNDMEET